MTLKSRTSGILILLMIITLIFTYLFVSGFFSQKGTMPGEKLPTDNASESLRINSSLRGFPPEIQGEIQSLTEKYSIAPKYWGFDPINNEIDLIADGINDANTIKNLQGKKIGAYSIHIYNKTDYEKTLPEVNEYLNELLKDSNYQITPSFAMVYGFDGPYVELWCYKLTPENKKLDNIMIKAWRINVMVCCAVPTSPSTSHINTNQPLMINSSVNVSRNFIDMNTSPSKLPPEVKQDIQGISRDIVFSINKCEYDPVKSNEINLYAHDIRNVSLIQELQGKQIGNYTIHIIHDTEFETTRSEVESYLSGLMKNPEYQITNFGMVTDPFVDPTGQFVEL